jgi:DNA-binding transcriptional LysR family regulator
MMMPQRSLDIDSVRAFALVADLASFTRAAEASGTTQSAVSLKLKRLEDSLGRRLVERSPRLVRLSSEGEAFLPRARDLLAAHERALTAAGEAPRRLRLGISEHVAGAELPGLLSRLAAHDPQRALAVRLDLSRVLLDVFDAGELDAVIVRRDRGRGDMGRRDGETLFEDAFGWFAAPGWRRRADEPLRLVTLSAECGVRTLAVRALDRAGIAWTEAFIGGGLAAVNAAIMAGLGVTALARRVAPAGSVEAGAGIGLPRLPASAVVLHSHVADAATNGLLRLVAAGFRAAGP